MLERQICQEYPLEKRGLILRDNCEKVEEVVYNKPFTQQDLERRRVDLENVSIAISDLNQQKKEYLDSFKEEMSPLAKSHAKAVSELKAKTVQVTENCFKFLDEESRTVGFYNSEGLLVYSRPAYREELNRSIMMEARRTGTDD